MARLGTRHEPATGQALVPGAARTEGRRLMGLRAADTVPPARREVRSMDGRMTAAALAPAQTDPLGTVAERVAAGIAYLDTMHDRWPDRVIAELLDLADPCRCVLGQIAGDYHDTPFRRDLWLAVVLGFEAPMALMTLPATASPEQYADWHRRFEEQYAELTAAWVAAVRERQGSRA